MTVTIKSKYSYIEINNFFLGKTLSIRNSDFRISSELFNK